MMIQSICSKNNSPLIRSGSVANDMNNANNTQKKKRRTENTAAIHSESRLLHDVLSTSIMLPLPRLDDTSVDELHDLLAHSGVLHMVLQSAWVTLCLLKD